jgi:hypothetical protein
MIHTPAACPPPNTTEPGGNVRTASIDASAVTSPGRSGADWPRPTHRATQAAWRICASPMPAGPGSNRAARCAAAGSRRKLTAPILSLG